MNLTVNQKLNKADILFTKRYRAESQIRQAQAVQNQNIPITISQNAQILNPLKMMTKIDRDPLGSYVSRKEKKQLITSLGQYKKQDLIENT